MVNLIDISPFTVKINFIAINTKVSIRYTFEVCHSEILFEYPKGFIQLGSSGVHELPF